MQAYHKRKKVNAPGFPRNSTYWQENSGLKRVRITTAVRKSNDSSVQSWRPAP